MLIAAARFARGRGNELDTHVRMTLVGPVCALALRTLDEGTGRDSLERGEPAHRQQEHRHESYAERPAAQHHHRTYQCDQRRRNDVEAPLAGARSVPGGPDTREEGREPGRCGQKQSGGAGVA